MTPAARDRTLFAVWGAMVASILVYAAVAAWALRGSAPSPSRSGVDLWLDVEAAGTAWAAIVLWKTRRSDLLRSGALDPATPAGRSALRRVSIVCWALVESIAIFGLVLVFLRRTPIPGAVFLGAALAIELSLFPRAPARPGAPGVGV
ncbi:MAG TPA: hypothetical protein VFL12_12805 [Thermoanaerobaculia bacterium]|nr:hypothetical protein [Thermoanaerobaculia bacterium]